MCLLKTSLKHHGGIDQLLLEEVMAVPPQACMPLQAIVTMCCWEAPSSLFPIKELAVVKVDKCFYLKQKGLV